jgi:AraC-like DNA-binding protein
MNLKISFDWYMLFVFLGICQSLLLSVLVYIKGRKTGFRFTFLSLFIFSLFLVLTEVFLDYSGYMINLIQIDKFSFPAQFLIAPSLFLFIKKSLYPDRPAKPWLHYLPFLFILLYFLIYFFQDNALKYNLHIEEHDLDLKKLPSNPDTLYDPLKIHAYFHILVFTQLCSYAVFLGRIIYVKYKEDSLKVFTTEKSYLNQYRNLLIYYLLALVFMAFLLLKYFWMGDFVFSLYLTGIVYLISINISYRSLSKYYQAKQALKYASSTLNEVDKYAILEKVKGVIEDEDFYCRGNASLEELSRQIKESRHSVSQVINELLGKSFFEYLAEHRISKSKSLLSDPKYQNITIDEISFMVGYNSRSAFNRVFKSMTGTTPDKYR